MFRGKGGIAAWILGGVTFVSLIYYLFRNNFFSGSSVPRIEFKAPATKDTKIDNEVDDLNKEEEEDEEEEEEEDEEEEEEDEDEEVEEKKEEVVVDPKEAELQLNKLRYDAASNDCKTLISAQNYAGAVEKLNELIGLAGKVPRGQSELITLYNNRSAMFEKLQEFEKALSDIRVMLTMQPDHVRARTRRARIYEQQGLLREAVDEYVVCNWIEQARQEQPTNEARAAPLFKKISVAEAQKTLEAVKKEVFDEKYNAESDLLPPLSSTTTLKDKPLPSKAYMRNVFENYPNSSVWKAAHEKSNLALYIGALQEAKDSLLAVQQDEDAAANEVRKKVLFSALQLAQAQIAQDEFAQAFQIVRSVEDSAHVLANHLDTSSSSEEIRSWLSLFFELLGTEAQFRSLHWFALRCFKHSRSLCADNFSVCLKLASVYLEVECDTAVHAIYDALLEAPASASVSSVVNEDADADALSVSSGPPLPSAPLPDSFAERPLGLGLSSRRSRKAWVQLHRSSLLVARDNAGKYADQAADKAVAALEDIVALLDGKATAEAQACIFVAQLKIVNLLTHTKASMELTPTEEDQAKCRACIQALKLSNPQHEALLLLEAEQLSHEGEIEGALQLLDKAKRRLRQKRRDQDPEASDSAYMVAKASVLSAQAFAAMGAGQMAEAQGLFLEVNQLYTAALVLEPTAIEVMAQQAQLAGMVFGDFDTAVNLLQRAQPLYRSKEELQDLAQMLLTFEANQKALKKLRDPALLSS